MINLIKANFYMLKKSMAFKVLILLSFVSALIMTIISNKMATENLSQDIINIGSLFADFQMISLLVILISSSFICSDFQSKTIQDAIACGNSRLNIIISKSIVYAFAVGILVLPYGLVSFIAFCTGYDYVAYLPSVFLNLMSNEGDYALCLSVILKIIAIFLTIFTVYAGQLSICIFLGFTFRKPTIVIAGGYFLSILMAKLVSVNGIKDVLAYTPFGVDYYSITLSGDALDFIKPVIISIIFIVIMVLITYCLFRKSEVK